MVNGTKLALSCLHSLACVISVILHAVGIHFLLKIKTMSNNQRIHLINISVLEILLPTLQGLMVPISDHIACNKIFGLIALVQTFGVVTAWFVALIALTLDRLLQIKLNILYPIYITERITKITLFAEMLVGSLIVFFILFSKVYMRIDLADVVHRIMFPTLTAALMLLFFVIYTYIYKKLQKLNQVTQQRVNNNTTTITAKNTLNTRRRSNIFIPFWIVLTFVIFFIFPESAVVIMMYRYHLDLRKSPWYTIPYIFFAIGWISDALIYILLKGSIRKRFLALFGCKHNIDASVTFRC